MVRTENILNGEQCTEGRQSGVRQLCSLVEERDLSAGEVVSSDLQVADVYAVLADFERDGNGG